MNTDNDSKEYISFQIERYKALLDYSKQLTTLSTGSIVLIAGFIEKAFPSPEWETLTVLSLVAFMVSIISAVIAHTMFIFDFPPHKSEQEVWVAIFGGGGLVFAWTGFLVGIVCLAIFAAKNLT